MDGRLTRCGGRRAGRRSGSGTGGPHDTAPARDAVEGRLDQGGGPHDTAPAGSPSSRLRRAGRSTRSPWIWSRGTAMATSETGGRPPRLRRQRDARALPGQSRPSQGRHQLVRACGRMGRVPDHRVRVLPAPAQPARHGIRALRFGGPRRPEGVLLGRRARVHVVAPLLGPLMFRWTT